MLQDDGEAAGSATQAAGRSAGQGGLLIRHARAIMTGLPGRAMRHDPALGTDVRIRDGVIVGIGHLAPMPGEESLDARGCVVYPGWINTHHHLFQSLLKGIPAGIDAPLMAWLAAVPVPYRRYFNREEPLRIAARIGLVELMLSGCSTVADHAYAYYPSMPYDASEVIFDEARRLGVRMVLCRGGQTVARGYETNGPPEAAPETLDAYLAAVERDVRRFHDPSPRAMRRVACAPTTPTWSVEPGEMKAIVRAARAMGIRLHSHLSETADYVSYCREVHACTPLAFVERHEWVGPDVWYAHLVHLSAAEIERLAETGTGMAHCPQSNCRLGSGIAPVPQLLRQGGAVSLAVDGAASNEAADMLSEAHACWHVHRAAQGAGAMTAEDVIRIGSAGGAKVLGLDGVGTLAPGMAADLAVYAPDVPRDLGHHDPAIAPVTGGRARLRALVVDGRIVARDGDVPGIDLQQLAADAQRLVAAMP
ncbi:MAG TPA: amidohydrolase family protein [Burkholderiaceae bacterium]|nr:amidohydrolase family protein [Burkholderiaceae bacterium]